VITVQLRKANPTKVKAGAVVIGVLQGKDAAQPAAGSAEVVASFGRRFAANLGGLGVTGAAGQVVKVPGGDGTQAPVVAIVGLGAADRLDAEALRRAAGAAVRQLAGTETVAFALRASSTADVRAIADGAALGSYEFARYSGEDKPAPVRQALIVTDLARDKATLASVRAAGVIAGAVAQARDWVNTPPGDLVPAAFAESIQALAAGTRLRVDVHDERWLAGAGCGGILGVGQGSAHPPRLVELRYRPRGARGHLALVGKGITFDSGGLSLKTAAGMMTMKCDMAGAAAVVAAMHAVAELELPVAVSGWACLAENMPSGTATRPGDVLTMYGGRTVEVLNTDAEGRLVLADGLGRASEESPDVLVDVATLTGACVVALGDRVAGVLSNDDDLLAQVCTVASDVGEAMWPLPIPDEMGEKVRASKIADLGNHNSDKFGGALYAAAFLREFVGEGIRWAHLDIAGPAFNESEPYGYTPRGGTGAAVRTLVALAAQTAAGEL
jgi:leucyl aminopeptidase